MFDFLSRIGGPKNVNNWPKKSSIFSSDFAVNSTLLVGDRLFVTKYSYGYSKHSFPFSPPILNKRVAFSSPKRGDVIVFKTPADNRTDYIKRLIGLPGDEIQFIDGDLHINNNQVLKSLVSKSDVVYCGKKIEVKSFTEKLSIFFERKFETIQKMANDNKMYYVQDYNNPEEAANTLSFLAKQSLVLIDNLSKKYPDNNGVARLKEKFNPDKIRVIYNFIDIEKLS